ncbi:MAG: recombinase family protein [Eubacteriales bacterium]|nr:recombinase family protein [Eubacteriales bacterium]
MKNRRFPYGYEMVNGCIQPCKEEIKILNRIFSDYIGGENLKNIAELLTKQKVEYLPGEYGWNKNRIKRIIEDERYLGDDTYPKLISVEMYHQANAIKAERRTTTDCIVHSDNKPFVYAVKCAKCGCKMLHRTDRNKKLSETWYCQNSDCKATVTMNVSDMQNKVTMLLNQVINNPQLAKRSNNTQLEFSMNIRKAENEINRMLEQLDFDKEILKNLIFECAAKKYNEDQSARHITDRLKADFENSSPLSELQVGFFQRTVSQILLACDGSVHIRLKNNNIIGKEPDDDECSNSNDTESSQNYTSEARICG